MTKTFQCYNCGDFFTKKDITMEHIPARNLFDGFDEKCKLNRLTVTSCKECNQGYSQCDETFRNLIGVISNKPKLDSITSKTVRSLTRKGILFSKLVITIGGRKAFSFPKQELIRFHKKMFKGIYFKEYSKHLPDNFEIIIDMNESNQPIEASIKFLKYLKSNFKWKYSGHSEVFKYIIQPFRENFDNNGKDIQPIHSDSIFLSLLVYNNVYAVMAYATNRPLPSLK